MRYELSLPSELEKAKEKNIPLVIAGGTIEYHGRHCTYGCDGIIVDELLKILEKKKEIIIAPPIWYSPSSYVVGGRDSGTVHIAEDTFENYCYYVLSSFIWSGFKNIYVVIHHQFEQENLMPMTLCYIKAAKRAIFDYLYQTKGEGWWGSEESKDYYKQVQESSDPFNWIKVIPAMTKEVQNATGYDHAGLYECSLLMALNKDTVNLERLKEKYHWFAETAKDANIELGNRMLELTLKSLDERIK